MKKGLIKTGVLLMVFCVSLVVFSTIANQKNMDLTMHLEEATLPVVYAYHQNEKINQLFGYTEEMEAQYMRDTITPLEENLLLPIEIDTYGAEVSSISYEVRSMDTERLIEQTQVQDVKESGKMLKAELPIQNLLKDNQEYILILTLTCKERPIHYYTRIVRDTNSNVKESIDFVKDFHEQTLHYDENTSKLATYLEPDSSEENNSLSHVTIHSSLSQVTWGEFKGTPLGGIRVSIKEINRSCNVILLNYVMSSVNDAGEQEYYNVEEYYRVRYTTDRVYLLNFERTMSQIFRGENSAFHGNSLMLGIRDKDVEYTYNEDGNVICFVQDGSLWCYDQTSNKLTQIFTFRSLEGMDERENNDQHGIRIIRIDADDNVDFVVYGYMNRGNHEGEVGTAVYHYDVGTNTIEEKLFLPSRQSYQVMKESFGELMYESADQYFYFMQEGGIYAVNLKEKKEKILIDGLPEGMYSISVSNRYVAWATEKKNKNGNKIVLYDLERQQEYTIDEGKENYLKPLGFMDTDFIYGIAAKKDITYDGNGNQTFPMYAVKIIDTIGKEHKVLKDYEKPGFYVSNLTITGNSINLSRLQYNGTAFVEAPEDTIKSNEENETVSDPQISTLNAGAKQLQVQLVLKNEVKEQAPKFLTSNDVIVENDTTLEIKTKNVQSKYYTYAKGEVIGVTVSLKEAIHMANESLGVVVDDKQRYIWKRAKDPLRNPIPISVSNEENSTQSVAQALSSILNTEDLIVKTSPMIARGETPYEILKGTMKEYEVLDLKGCTLNEVLYYVNLGTPVFAMSGSDSALVVIGYDANNVTLFDAATGDTQKMGLEDATAVFSAAGNQFVAYLK